MQTTPLDRTLTLVVLGVLLAGIFLVLQPFLTAIAWAAVLASSLWPMYAWVRRQFGGRGSLAALVMTLLILLVVVAPFVIVGATLAENSDRLSHVVREAIEQGPPDPPAWVASLPLVGDRASAYWASLAHDGASVIAELRRLLDPLRQYALRAGAVVADGLLQMTLSVLLAFFFFRDGEAIVARLRRAVAKIAPERGPVMLQRAYGTTRAVVYGILGTALAQGVLMAAGAWLAGIQVAPLLGLLVFFLSPVPVGPPLVWIPTAIWLIVEGYTGWGVFLLIYGTLVVSSVDNLVKPMIISHGSDLPFMLVLLGIFGGVIAFGFIGVFLGPVLLAIGFAMVREWAAEPER